MKKIMAMTAVASALVMVPAGLATANNGNDNGQGACVQLGQIHKPMATSGMIPGEHLPGAHKGMAGLCFFGD